MIRKLIKKKLVSLQKDIIFRVREEIEEVERKTLTIKQRRFIMRVTDVLLSIVKVAVDLGQTLWSPVYGNVTYRGIVEDNIICTNSEGAIVSFRKDGKLYKDGECMLYLEKNNQDWLLFARQKDVTCPLYEEFCTFLRSREEAQLTQGWAFFYLRLS